MTRQLRLFLVIEIALAFAATVANTYKIELPRFFPLASEQLESLPSESALPESHRVEGGIEEPPEPSKSGAGHADIIVGVIVLIGFVVAWVGLWQLKPWARTVYSAMLAIGVEALLFLDSVFGSVISQGLAQLLGVLAILAAAVILALLWLSPLASNFRNNTRPQSLWAGFLLAPLASPAVLLMWTLVSASPNHVMASVLLIILLGIPYSYVGFVGLGWPLIAIVRAFSMLTFWRIILLFALLGATTYWFSLLYVVRGRTLPLYRLDSLASVTEAFGIGALLGVVVGLVFFLIAGRVGGQGGRAEPTQRA
jgi:hypothetical protein